MIKEKRYFAYFILLILAPEVALANIAIPMVVFTLPSMFIMLVPIVIVEYIILKKRWPWVNRKLLHSSIGLGNFASTLIGIPISWCLYYFGITLPLDFLIYKPNSLSKSFLSSLQVFAEIFAGATFIYEVSTPLNSDLIIYIKLILMLLPAYFLSYWIEHYFIQMDGISKKEALAGARSANRYSYLFVLIVVAIFFTAHYVKLFLRHYNW